MLRLFHLFKRKLGYVRLGILGFFENNFIKIPKISESLESFNIGKSVQGKNIKCFKIGNGKTKLLYAFGIHGNETGTVKLAHHFLEWLENFKNDKYTIFVIPCLNPDGYSLALKNPEYFKGGKTGRYNANGVDLNRNFDTPNWKQDSEWTFGKNYSERTKVYCGEHGGSEPEIKALTNFIKTEDIGVLFMYHNSGKDLVSNNLESAINLAKIYSKETGFKLINFDQWMSLKQTGTALEWSDVNKIAYIEIEGSTRWGSDWKQQKNAFISSIFANKF